MCGPCVWLRRGSLPKYIQKRRRLWYAVLEIPAALRETLGKPRYFKSLETDSESVALRRAAPLIAKWKIEIGEARTGTRDPLEADALYWHNALRGAGTEDETDHLRSFIADLATDMHDKGREQQAERFFAIATGEEVKTDQHLEEWLATLENTDKTADMKKSDVLRLAARFPTTRLILKKEVRRWCDGLIQSEGLKPKTVTRILSACRGYWAFLQSVEVVPEDLAPFNKLNLPQQSRHKNGKADERRHFEPEEVVALFNAAKEPAKGRPKGDDQLADLISLAMWTGARIEELCSLKCDKVKKDFFEIVDAKTAAGWRQVPIHSKLKTTVDRLVKSSKDGYVLCGLTENKYGDRSNAIGKRFGHLKTKLGYGPPFVFHSIRKTVVTILENAGVPEGVVADIVGHEKKTMTYGLYSGGATLEVKRRAIKSLKYPQAH